MMQKIFNTYRPDGFSTVNAYLFVDNPQMLIDFLKNAFYAQEIMAPATPGSVGAKTMSTEPSGWRTSSPGRLLLTL